MKAAQPGPRGAPMISQSRGGPIRSPANQMTGEFQIWQNWSASAADSVN